MQKPIKVRGKPYVLQICMFFAFLRQKIKKIADPLNPDQWFFLVCPTSVLNQHFGVQEISFALYAGSYWPRERLNFDTLRAKIL